MRLLGATSEYFKWWCMSKQHDCDHRVTHHEAISISTDEVYRKALNSAVVDGHVDIVRELVKFGADINQPIDFAFGMAPLHVAAHKGSCEMLEELIRMGANPDVREDFGRTPLFIHDIGPISNPVLYEILLRAGADINARDKYGATALHETCGVSNDPTHMRMCTLLKHGADIEAVDKRMRTTLHHAVLVKNAEAVKVLLEVGCNVEARDHMQRTPLHYAAGSGSCVDELLDSGRVDLEAVTVEGFTPLISAARKGGACYSLLEAGATVSATDNTGRTALHWASRHGHEDCLECLLGFGADEDAVDDKQLTAKDLALDGAHWAICDLLS